MTANHQPSITIGLSLLSTRHSSLLIEKFSGPPRPALLLSLSEVKAFGLLFRQFEPDMYVGFAQPFLADYSFSDRDGDNIRWRTLQRAGEKFLITTKDIRDDVDESIFPIKRNFLELQISNFLSESSTQSIPLPNCVTVYGI